MIRLHALLETQYTEFNKDGIHIPVKIIDFVVDTIPYAIIINSEDLFQQVPIKKLKFVEYSL